ncbi:hypothetical protein ACXZ9C_11080 [Streptococcus agalactiae]
MASRGVAWRSWWLVVAGRVRRRSELVAWLVVWLSSVVSWWLVVLA